MYTSCIQKGDIKMGRKKKFLFDEPRMFSARVERSDLEKVQELLDRENRTVQEFINECVREYISGSLEEKGER
jgi:hypothetical protein